MWIEDVAAVSGTLHEPVHRFVEICFDGHGYISMRIERTIVSAADVFRRVLLASIECVAHVGFEAVRTPVTAKAVFPHIFRVGLCSGVVVKNYFVESRCGSGVVYDF